MTRRAATKPTEAAGWAPIAELKRWDKNPRQNRPIRKVALSIVRFGFVAPCVVWTSAGRLVAGHTRLDALELLQAEQPVFRDDRCVGWEPRTEPFTPIGAPGPGVARVVFHEFADQHAADAYAIADNKLNELASWDKAVLRDVMLGMPDLSAMRDIGYSQPALDRLLRGRSVVDDSRMATQRYEVLIHCPDEPTQTQTLDSLIRAGREVSAITLRVAERKPKPPPPQNPVPSGRLEIVRRSEVRQTARVKQCAGIFDLPTSEVSEETWSIDVSLPEMWNIGLIVGPSGSGKSTLARELFADDLSWTPTWRHDHALVDDFPEGMSIHDITELLSSVGFSSPPAWLRSHAVLSTGQQFRANIARLLAERREISVVDEYTSVVDRTVAQIGSAAVARAVRQRRQRFVAVTCHYDVADWLCPDWVIEMPSGQLTRGALQRPSIHLEVRRVRADAWRIFRRHHYLTADINQSACCYVALLGGEPVTFASVIFQLGGKGFRAHRSVCLPDYQGIGIGHALQAKVAAMYATVGPFTMKISSPAVIAHAMRSSDWELIGQPSRFVDTHKSTKGSRSSPRYGCSFRWIGPKDYAGAQAFGIRRAS